MTKVKCSYLGNIKYEAIAIHIDSRSLIRKDSPLDHWGKGKNFSPTALLATSLCTCPLTIIKAKSKEVNLKGIYLYIEKIITQNRERTIKELIINIFIPDLTSNDTIYYLKKVLKNIHLQEIHLKK